MGTDRLSLVSRLIFDVKKEIMVGAISNQYFRPKPLFVDGIPQLIAIDKDTEELGILL